MCDKTVGVVGAGVMGAGIAQMLAETGCSSLLWDADPAALNRGLSNIRARLERSVAKGKIPVSRVAEILERIRPAGGLADFATPWLVIEAVVEDPCAKKILYAELEPRLGEHAVLATNTSSLSVSELADELARPERFLGVHFFNPPTKLELVELVSGTHTLPAVFGRVREFLVACGKTPVAVKDSPGFIVNRLLLLLVNEAVRMVDEGVATAEDVDTAMRLGALHPAGPLAVADLIGLDTCRTILGSLRETLGAEAYEAAPSIVRLVEEGRLGRKSGSGFFDY